MSGNKKKVLARLTVSRPNQVKLIVEVREGASFHEFYTWYQQTGRKRKVFLRATSRNDGFAPHWRAAFFIPGLDVVAARLQGFMKDVTGVTIKVMGKRKYNAMLTCAPDQLGSGLPKADQAQAKIEAFRARTGRGIPVQLPAYYLPLQKRMDILTGVKR